MDNKPPSLFANFTKELAKEHYGVPEKLWVDSDSDTIVIKTADKSLHLIKGKEKVWTRQEGLTAVKKWVVGKGQAAIQEMEDEETSMNPVTAFVKRVQKQTTTLMSKLQKTANQLNTIITQKQLPFVKPKKPIDIKYIFVHPFL